EENELLKPGANLALWGAAAVEVLNNPDSQGTVGHAVEKDGRALIHATPVLKDQKEVALKAVAADGTALMFVSEAMQRDKDVVLAAVRQDGTALRLAAEHLAVDKEVVLVAVSQCGQALRHAADQLRDDKDVCLAAVQQSGRALKYVSERMRDDKDVVDAAIENTTEALPYVGPELKEEWENVLTERWKAAGLHIERRYFDFDELDEEEICRPAGVAVSPDMQPKQRLSEGMVTLQVVAAMTGGELCKLLNVAMSTTIWDIKERIEHVEGTKLNAQKLLGADGKVAQDDSILADVIDCTNPVLSLIRSPPVWAGLLEHIAAGEVQLEDLDDGARGDRCLVLAAVHASQGRALAHASVALRGDKDIVTEAVKRNGLSLRHATPSMRADRDVVLAAIRECPMALEFASDLLRKDHDFIVTAVRVSARAAGCVTEELQKNSSFAGELLSAFPAVFAHLPPELRSSQEFVLRAVRRNGDVLRFAAGWHSHPEVVLTAIQKAPQAVHFVEASLRQRAEFGTAAVMANPWVFEQLGSLHRNDLALAMQAARAQPALAHFAGEHIKGEVLVRIKKEQSEAFGAPEGYVDGPVWWLPETLKQKPAVEKKLSPSERRELISQLKRRGSTVDKEALSERLLYADGTLTSNVKDLMVGISALKDAGAWYSALNVLVGLVEMEVALDLPLVNCVMSACKNRGHELAQQLFSKFVVSAKLRPDANTFRCAALCCREDEWSSALQWLGRAKEEAVTMTGIYVAVMSVSRRARCWQAAFPLLQDMQQVQEAPDRKFFNSALWSCSAGQWEVCLHLLHRMEVAGVPSEPFTYFAAAQEIADKSTAACMVQQLQRMREHSLRVDICQFAKMLAHYASDAEWPATRQAVLEHGGFLLPSRRCLTHTYDEDISWYGAHVQASKNLTRQWLESFPAQTQYSDWRRLRKSLKKSGRPTEESDYSDLGAHAGYIRNKVFEKARCAQLACVLFGPEAFTCGLQEKESCVVVDIGGGPGIAALGLSIYAALEGWPVHLKHHVVDCENAWYGTLLRLQNVLRQNSLSSLTGVRTDLYFHQGQLLSKTLADGMPAPGDTDLFLFSYVMHENVEALRSTNFGLLPTLLEAAQSDTIFLFLDVEDTLWSEIVMLATSLGRFKIQLQQFRKDEYWLVLQKTSAACAPELLHCYIRPVAWQVA
ncbi:unnamed protein product, partial [Symbiodinium pilosum]